MDDRQQLRLFCHCFEYPPIIGAQQLNGKFENTTGSMAKKIQQQYMIRSIYNLSTTTAAAAHIIYLLVVYIRRRWIFVLLGGGNTLLLLVWPLFFFFWVIHLPAVAPADHFLFCTARKGVGPVCMICGSVPIIIIDGMETTHTQQLTTTTTKS